MDYRFRRERLEQFESMLGEYPKHDFHHRTHGWPYHTQNPWGFWVIGYCRFLDDAHRLDCRLAKGDPIDRDGLYARWRLDTLTCLELVAFTDDETIDRSAYEYWMERFHELILEDPDFFGPHLGQELIRVGVARRKNAK